MSPQSKSSHLI